MATELFEQSDRSARMKRVAGAVLGLMLAPCGAAQTPPDMPAPIPAIVEESAAPEAASPELAEAATVYEMAGSAVHRIVSPVLERSYDLYVKLPPGYRDDANASRSYPVLYVADGHYPFQTAAGVMMAPMNHGGFEHAILVGVSYAVGENGGASRTRDLTPVRNPDNTNPTGGARDFLTFLRDEAIPVVEAQYRTDPARRIYAGQSYGGLFGAYALLNEPGLFHDYILTSPSLWFADGAMFAMEAELAQNDRAPEGRVFFAIGETETPAINGGRYDMVGDQKRFADLLRSRGHDGLDVRDVVVEDGTHLTTFPVGLLRGLMWVLPGDKPYGG
jgi:predicted alpha/beta superfamily hydrolase